jgi:hypothetical protein
MAFVFFVPDMDVCLLAMDGLFVFVLGLARL